MADAPLIPAARMAGLFDIPERTLDRILHEARVPHTAGKGYDFNASIRAAIAHYRTRAEALDESVATDRARKTKSEANMAQLQEEKMIGNLASLDTCRRLFECAVVQTRGAVRKLKCLDDAQKHALCEAFADAKFEEAGIQARERCTGCALDGPDRRRQMARVGAALLAAVGS
jgi:hypothetical protein